VDVDTFESMGRIRLALLGGSVAEALTWCQENKKELRKMESKLEFMLRLQQYIELVRAGTPNKFIDAIAHAKKFLAPFRVQYPAEFQQACGLLAIPPGSPTSLSATTSAAHTTGYAGLYRNRWQELADLFTTTHNQLLSLPSVPLLHIALSSGLSALKTPACHTHAQQQAAKASSLSPRGEDDGDVGATSAPAAAAAAVGGSTRGDKLIGQGLCPICSAELNDLARFVPYAHHTKSHVQPDLVMLPSRKARSRLLLLEDAKKAGLEANTVRDPVTQELCPTDDLKKVYIT
jgi:macrophage erythroblast attacher